MQSLEAQHLTVSLTFIAAASFHPSASSTSILLYQRESWVLVFIARVVQQYAQARRLGSVWQAVSLCSCVLDGGRLGVFDGSAVLAVPCRVLFHRKR
jgi:hypothetical protein